jgi:Type II secretion system (T2SS), protein E, N-terminal domain
MSRFLKPITWSADWIKRHRPAPAKRETCSLAGCPGPRSLWHRLVRGDGGTLLHGQFYCGPQCLETALVGQISRLRALAPPVLPPNRIPLGLLMVARGKLTHIEVRAALEAQRRARYGSIGEWIEKLGFATELDVTSALALQWGCPVASSFESSIPDFPGIPFRILEAFQMLPLHYAVSTNTLCIAFGARVDHAALYAIEKILECRTQPCVAPPKRIARELESMRQLPRLRDVEFTTRDLEEMARITSSYVSRLHPEEVRLNRIGQFLWLRLKSHSVPTNVLFCLQPPSPMRPSPPEFPLPAQRWADSLSFAKREHERQTAR